MQELNFGLSSSQSIGSARCWRIACDTKAWTRARHLSTCRCEIFYKISVSCHVETPSCCTSQYFVVSTLEPPRLASPRVPARFRGGTRGWETVDATGPGQPLQTTWHIAKSSEFRSRNGKIEPCLSSFSFWVQAHDEWWNLGRFPGWTVSLRASPREEIAGGLPPRIAEE